MTTTVANTILSQLGDGRFLAMTGAKDLVGGDRMLQFRLPARAAKNGINKVAISLDDNDTYFVAFYRLRGIDCKTVVALDMIPVENLCEVFTRYTGLETSL